MLENGSWQRSFLGDRWATRNSRKIVSTADVRMPDTDMLGLSKASDTLSVEFQTLQPFPIPAKLPAI